MYSPTEIKSLLDQKTVQYNNPDFILSDPISIPHLFTKKEDIEIAGFFAATFAWGQRTTTINKATYLLKLMNNSPYNFIMHFRENDLSPFRNFSHRTFNGIDCEYFLWSLKNIYQKYGNLENAFFSGLSADEKNVKQAISNFRERFFNLDHPKRTQKHIADPMKNATAKRINMFLRWMVRQDDNGVDFGIWKKISPAQLVCPIDVHSGNVARRLGLLTRKANDWKAVEELTTNLGNFDPLDPVKYDFALFGMGIFEKNHHAF